MPMAQTKITSESASSLDHLANEAADRKPAPLHYAGEVFPQEAYQFLQENDGILIDVRTPQEWQGVGTASLEGCAGRTVEISWKTLPDFTINPNFSQQISAINGVSKDTPLFFLCRSGGRSLDAAVTIAAEGYRYCFNVTGGFEGDHHGNTPGWKQRHLPCKQGA